MTISNKSIVSKYSLEQMDESLTIYEGNLCIYSSVNIRFNGRVYYDMTDTSSIKFEGTIYKFDELEEDIPSLMMDSVSLEILGYKLIDADITSIKNNHIEGYVNDFVIKSKDNKVDYVQFDIVNMDKIPGKLVKYQDLVYAGRIEFTLNDYKIIIDKSYGYNKDLKASLEAKSSNIITHTGRIYRKNEEPFNTRKVDQMISRIATALSFASGRYVSIPNTYGYHEDREVYRAWYRMARSGYKFVFNWTSTISNYHNIEKYMSLMCKKLEEDYYNDTISNVLDWYMESINGMNLGNNIISVQTALEMLSYVVLVETENTYRQSVYDKHSSKRNIRELLDHCGIDGSIPKECDMSDNIKTYFSDSVDAITFYRNSVVHPSRNKKIYLDFESMFNIILLGISYIELVILYLIGYKGEYTDRFKDYSFGDVHQVAWTNKNKNIDK